MLVIGLGAFGSATAYQLAKRGASVIGIDRFTPPHDQGSSHGATRITRLAVGEGEVYVPLVKRSNQIWQELEIMTGQSLYKKTGGLIMGPADGRIRHHGKTDFVRRTIDAAVRYDIAHEVLDARGISDRFPQFLTRGDELGYFEPDSGVLKPERCVDAQLQQARSLGAKLQFGETVASIEADQGGVRVRTQRGIYLAKQAIVTAGPWVPALVGGAFVPKLRVMRQVLYWFKTSEPSLYASPRCPVFIWMHGQSDEDYVYGFPMVDGFDGVKVATEQYREVSDPDRLVREVSKAERTAMYERNVKGRLRSVLPDCVHSTTCPYTVSPDSGFIVDRHPELANVTVVSACSGHGFKHSSGVGEALAVQALGGSSDWSASFGMSRF